MKRRRHEVMESSDVRFWRWLSDDVIAIVTNSVSEVGPLARPGTARASYATEIDDGYHGVLVTQRQAIDHNESCTGMYAKCIELYSWIFFCKAGTE